jgi:hypothetical protein
LSRAVLLRLFAERATTIAIAIAAITTIAAIAIHPQTGISLYLLVFETGSQRSVCGNVNFASNPAGC